MAAGFTDAFSYAVLHKIDGKSAATSYVLERNNMYNLPAQVSKTYPLHDFRYNAASGGDAVLVAAHLANNTVGSCGKTFFMTAMMMLRIMLWVLVSV